MKVGNLVKITWKDWSLSQKTIQHHITCGKHTKIPKCCIEWFVGPWTVISNIPYLREAYWEENDKLANVNYVRCPTCIENRNVVKIKKCDCYENR